MLPLALLVLFVLTGCLESPPSQSSQPALTSKMEALQAGLDDLDSGPVYVVAHRGCWSSAPENSLQAMEDCIDLGVEVAEIDVMMTADRKLVVFHDPTLDRMTNGTGLVREKTLADLKTLRLFERDGSPHQIMGKRLLTAHQIPTLGELLEVTRGRLLLNLEIKSNEVFGFEETFAASVALAREMGVENEILWKIPAAGRTYGIEIIDGFSGSDDPATPADTIVNALDLEGLRYVTPIVWKSDRDFETQIADLTDGGIRSFEIVTDDLAYWPTAADGRVAGADQYRYLGVGVLPRWSGGLSDDVALEDPDAAWGRLLELGADSIMTDRPEQLLRYLRKSGRR